jgi:hypothetical protein
MICNHPKVDRCRRWDFSRSSHFFVFGSFQLHHISRMTSISRMVIPAVSAGAVAPLCFDSRWWADSVSPWRASGTGGWNCLGVNWGKLTDMDTVNWLWDMGKRQDFRQLGIFHWFFDCVSLQGTEKVAAPRWKIPMGLSDQDEDLVTSHQRWGQTSITLKVSVIFLILHLLWPWIGGPISHFRTHLPGPPRGNIFGSPPKHVPTAAGAVHSRNSGKPPRWELLLLFLWVFLISFQWVIANWHKFNGSLMGFEWQWMISGTFWRSEQSERVLAPTNMEFWKRTIEHLFGEGTKFPTKS